MIESQEIIIQSLRLTKDDVAVGISHSGRSQITVEAVKMAKDAGVKFTLGTNNGGANDLGRMDYALEMIAECGLTPQDMWMPGR